MFDYQFDTELISSRRSVCLFPDVYGGVRLDLFV